MCECVYGGTDEERGWARGGESFFCKLWDFLCFCVDSPTSTLDLVVSFSFYREVGTCILYSNYIMETRVGL